MRLAVTVVSIAVLAVAATVLGLFLWLRTYAPLIGMRPIEPGASLAADVEPTYGSEGKAVYVPVYRRGGVFSATFTLENTGRFAVTVLGTDPERPGALTPVGLALGPGAFAGNLKLDPHDSAAVSVRWRLDCAHAPAEVAAERIRLRYRYLSIFTRTQTVELPFAVTLRC